MQENKNVNEPADVEKFEEVNATIKSIEEEKKVVAVRPKWLTALMIIFFPITGLVYLLQLLQRKLKVRLTVKMTLIYTMLFALSVIVFSVFILTSIGKQLPDTAEAAAYMRELILTTVIIISVFVVLFICLGSVLAQVVLSPIRKITEKIDNITSESLSTRLDPIDAQDELKELTNRINIMLDNLEQSFERQQNFVADASHELKTPIAVIQGYANLLTRWGKEKPDILDEGIEAISSEADNMKKVVEQLLLLARLGRMNMNKTKVNLSSTVQGIAESYGMVTPSHEIIYDGTEGITVYADKALLIESIRTLVDNAIKYTPAGGRINITVRYDTDHALIEVEDTGMGIAAKDIDKVFDRFYRCDKARGREQGSCGLGLTIAKNIIEMMGGNISLKSEVGKGSIFSIRLY